MLSAHHLRPVTSDHNPARQAMTPAQLRDLMPALANKTYFNYGGQGPLPTPSLEAITASWRRIQELGPFTGDIWPWLEREVGSLRGTLAALCGVPPSGWPSLRTSPAAACCRSGACPGRRAINC